MIPKEFVVMRCQIRNLHFCRCMSQFVSSLGYLLRLRSIFYLFLVHLVFLIIVGVFVWREMKRECRRGKRRWLDILKIRTFYEPSPLFSFPLTPSPFVSNIPLSNIHVTNFLFKVNYSF